MREILNAAYKKGGKVKRMKKKHTKEGEEQVVESFDLYTPVCMANIYGLDEVLQDRCISLILEKSTNLGVTKKMEDFEGNPYLLDIKRTLELAECSLCSVVTIKNYIKEWNSYIDQRYNNYTQLHTTLTTQNNTTTLEEQNLLKLFNKIDQANIDGRNLELFFPLLIVAESISPDLFEKTLLISKDLVINKKGDELAESKDVSLYEFISQVSPVYSIDYHYINDLTRMFRDFLGEVDTEDKWLNSKWFGRALKRLNLTTARKRTNKGMEVILNLKKARDKLCIFKTPEKETEEKDGDNVLPS